MIISANPMLEMIQSGNAPSSFWGALFAPIALPYTIILILLLAGLIVAAFKAKRWVLYLSRFTMTLVGLEMLIGFVRFMDLCQFLGVPNPSGSNATFCEALLPVNSVAFIGTLIYILSLFIRIAQKPRI